MKTKKLDFIVIGAQKAATTTIYKYLKEHERIILPEDKEAPFFNLPAVCQKDSEADAFSDTANRSNPQAEADHFQPALYDSFLDDHFLTQDPFYKGVWGKISPQYMSSDLIPGRIKQSNPEAKIIAVLRHPIKRAFSHYRMATRRGTEKRPFDEAMCAAIKNLQQGREGLAPTHQQGYESESGFYAAWGEYGRVLETYVQLFGKQNVLVLFAEDLDENPQKTLSQLLGFIGAENGLNSDWQPDCLGKKFHRGGGKPMINPQWLKSLVHTPVVHQIYSRIPQGFKKTARYWFDQINVRKEAESEIKNASYLSDTVLDKLYQLYRADAALLTQLGYRPPWEF